MSKISTVTNIKLPFEKKLFLLISDIHWDNPKCRRDVLKKHLDEAMQKDALILLNGDTFCLMQGKADPRRAKQDVRPEHNVANYFDAVVEDAVNWFGPYAKNIALVGYGNHETSILKHNEIDVIQRFVFGLNAMHGGNVESGGYGGWVRVAFIRPGKTKNHNGVTYNIKYHHGYGGGGPVTRGTIQHNRQSVNVEGADMIWMGHVHEDYELTYSVETFSRSKNYPEIRDVIMMRTSTYKDEFEDGSKGWHIEKGRGPKFIGGRWLELEPYRIRKDDRDLMKINARTYKTF